MLQKIITVIANIGVVRGLTFKCEQQPGVGMFIVPNAAPNRMHPQAIPDTPMLPRRRRNPSGKWTAKPLHVIW